MTTRILSADDAASYQRLRLQGLRESPSAFAASFSEEEGRSLAEVALRINPGADQLVCTFGAFADHQLVGLVTLVRPSREKLHHAAELCGMFVAPTARRRGHGRALLDAVLAHARLMPGLRQLKLSVNAANGPACALYESLGFVRTGIEPDALFVDGCFYDDALYNLRLTPVPSGTTGRLPG